MTDIEAEFYRSCLCCGQRFLLEITPGHPWTKCPTCRETCLRPSHHLSARSPHRRLWLRSERAVAA